MKRLSALVFPALLAGCMDFGGNTGPGENVNLNGTWTGQLTLNFGADSIVGPAELRLQHVRNADDVDGSVDYAPIGDLVFVERDNEVSSILLTLQTRHDGSDACTAHIQTWEFRIFPAELNLRNVRGTVCEDLGGGNVLIRTITDGSGKLSR